MRLEADTFVGIITCYMRLEADTFVGGSRIEVIFSF